MRKPNGVSKTTLVVAIVALSLFGTAAGIALATVGPQGESTPVIVMLLGFLAPTIAALVALLRQDRSRDMIEQVDRKVEAVHERADELADAAVLDVEHARRPKPPATDTPGP